MICDDIIIPLTNEICVSSCVIKFLIDVTTGFEFPGFGTVGELSEMLPLGTAE